MRRCGGGRPRRDAVPDRRFEARGANLTTDVSQFEMNPEVVGLDLAGPFQEDEGLLGPVELPELGRQQNLRVRRVTGHFRSSGQLQ